jgi:hypothetical protein
MVSVVDFEEEHDAVLWAVANQKGRRNMTGGGLLELVAAVDGPKRQGERTDLLPEDKKFAHSHEATAELANTSPRNVSRLRAILKYAAATCDTEERDAVPEAQGTPWCSWAATHDPRRAENTPFFTFAAQATFGTAATASASMPLVRRNHRPFATTTLRQSPLSGRPVGPVVRPSAWPFLSASTAIMADATTAPARGLGRRRRPV